MNALRHLRVLALVVVAVLLCVSPALAAEPTTSVLSGAGIGVGLGCALIIVGAGLGFGKIGATALESMARQPEIAGRIQTAMIIIGALLEGATFFALLVCLLLNGKVTY